MCCTLLAIYCLTSLEIMICRVIWYVLLISHIKQNEPAAKDYRDCEIIFILIYTLLISSDKIVIVNKNIAKLFSINIQ